jgi:hypothetical protein
MWPELNCDAASAPPRLILAMLGRAAGFATTARRALPALALRSLLEE